MDQVQERGGIQPFKLHTPLMIKHNDRFEQYQLVIVDIWDRYKIEQLLSKEINFDTQMATYDTINIVLVYEFTDIHDNLTFKIHAVNIYFDFRNGVYQLFDSNQKSIINMTGDDQVYNLCTEMHRAYVMIWNLKYSSKDPNTKYKGFSYK